MAYEDNRQAGIPGIGTAAQNEDLPEDIATVGLGDAVNQQAVSDGPTEAEQGPARRREVDPRTKDRLLSWPEGVTNMVNAMFGIDVKKMLESQYTNPDALSALAFGRWTPPVECHFQYPNMNPEWGLYSIRVNVYQKKDAGEWVVSGGERRRIHLTLQKDKEGNYVRNNEGRVNYTYNIDRPDEEHVFSTVYGVKISKEERRDMFEALLATGYADQPLTVPTKDGTKTFLLQCNPYYPKDLLVCAQEYAAKMLANNPVYKDREGNVFNLDEKAVQNLSFGYGAYLKNEEGKTAYVRYNVAQGRITPSVSVEIAKKRERAKAQAQAKGESQSQTQEQEQSQEQSQGGGMRPH